MHEELLRLLEERREKAEIDKESYEELKARYSQKLERIKEELKYHEDAPVVTVAGEKTLTQESLSVSGSATIGGGKIMRDIRVSGAAKISNPVECNALRCSGSLKALGNIIAHGEIKCSGSFRCEGNLHGDQNATISGSAKISGEVVIQGNLSVSGSYTSYKNTQAIRGASLTGSTTIGANLLCENSIRIGGKARIEKNILCESILIEGRKTVFESWFFRKQKKLVRVHGSIIAQKDVDVQDVHVGKNIKGRTVKLGPNTYVEGTVYYVEDLFMSDSVRLNREPQKITQEELKL
jgi:cytoskeletal protein CcmA (bactofilin family)